MAEYTYAELRKIISGSEEDKPLSVKTSGILNYIFATRLAVASGKGRCTLNGTYDQLMDLIKEPTAGDVVAVVNTGLFLLVEVLPKENTAICARIELGQDLVYHLPKFSIANEPNGDWSSFNKFPMDNLFRIRKGTFNMEKVQQLYENFKHVWTEIRKLRDSPDDISEGS